MSPRRKNNETQPSTPEEAVNPTPSTDSETTYIPATGLEDYGRWKAMFKDHKRSPKEKPFRRGRIWS